MVTNCREEVIIKLPNPFIGDGEFESIRKVLGRVYLILQFVGIVDLVLHVDCVFEKLEFWKHC
jgi:hypothetical protein